jgi:DNA-binding CsgD family transcriptional regulator
MSTFQHERLYCTAGECLEAAVTAARMTLHVDPPAAASGDERLVTFTLPLCAHHAELLHYGSNLAALESGELGSEQDALEQPGPAAEPPTPALTRREMEVLGGVTRGLTNAQIAAELQIARNTVKTTIRNAYRTLGVTSRAEAASWCLQHGFLPATEPPPEVHKDAG